MGYGWMAGVLFPAGAGDFSLLHSVQVVSDTHPISYPMVIGGCLPGVKRSAREADNWPLSVA
jgi:hypothetical protein